ncbi:MAG: PHP domain-containing protein [Solirubrobacteraceae bacterium]|nr:PHP domain-containing protein [Solirubrobacteraceae bacterium]
MPPRPDFDLQSHSTCSDGTLAPREVVARAAEAGVRLLALTDHDTVDGVAEAQAAGARHGVAVVTGVELSTVDPAGPDLHLLGYGFDPANPGLRTALEAFRADRQARIGRMADAMRELGWAIAEDELAGRKAPGRPHLARAVFHHPANAARLQEEGLDGFGAVLEAYLIEGKPGFCGRTMPTVPEAIDVVHAAGGVAVWAHPYWDIPGDAEVAATLRRFAAAGVDGVEAFYVTHSEAQTRHLAGLADELGLLTTGSTDFHGIGHANFADFLGFSLFGLEPRLGPLSPST